MTLQKLFLTVRPTVSLQNLATLRWEEYRLDLEQVPNGKHGVSYVVVSRRSGRDGAWVVQWKVDVSMIDELLERLVSELAAAPMLAPRGEPVPALV